jgi:DNA-binding response OmpR family regulator
MAGHFHVLVVEDDPLVLDVLQETLEDRYRVSSARTVQEAQTVLRTSHIDLALIDHTLPDGRGDDVAVFAAKAGTPVIKMSGYPEESLGRVPSARPHLFKPFAMKLLLSTVEDALRDN